MLNLLHDPHFWVLLSTLLFVLLVGTKGRGPILRFLDRRTERIKNSLSEAERLKAEAQELLSLAHREHQKAIETAQRILEGAQETAQKLEYEAQLKLSEAKSWREAQVLQRIERMKSDAIQEIQTRAADLAAVAAEQLLKSYLAKGDKAVVDQSIQDLSELRN